MTALLWFSGIGWNTSVRKIGWTYVILILCVVTFIYTVIRLINELRRP